MNTYTNGQNKIEKEGSNLGKVPSFSRPPPILDHGGLGEKESLVSWEKIFEFQNQSSIKYTNLYKYMRHVTTKESTKEKATNMPWYLQTMVTYVCAVHSYDDTSQK